MTTIAMTITRHIPVLHTQQNNHRTTLGDVKAHQIMDTTTTLLQHHPMAVAAPHLKSPSTLVIKTMMPNPAPTIEGIQQHFDQVRVEIADNLRAGTL